MQKNRKIANWWDITFLYRFKGGIVRDIVWQGDVKKTTFVMGVDQMLRNEIIQ